MKTIITFKPIQELTNSQVIIYNGFINNECIEYFLKEVERLYNKETRDNILKNPEKMKERFRIIFTDPVNFGKGYHDTTDDCYRRIIDFLDEHKKIETTITIKVQDKVSGKFLYLVHNKS